MMGIIAITQIRHGIGDGEEITFEPGDDVAGVPDDALLSYVECGAVLLTGDDRGLAGQIAEPAAEPPITSAADPRYLQQQRDERDAAAAEKAARVAQISGNKPTAAPTKAPAPAPPTTVAT